MASQKVLLTTGNILELRPGSLGTTHLVEITPSGVIVWSGQDSPSDFKTKIDQRLVALRLTNPDVDIAEAIVDIDEVAVVEKRESSIKPKQPTPVLEKDRLAEKEYRIDRQLKVLTQKVESEPIIEAIPESSKPKGKAALGKRLMNALKPVINLIVPKLQQLAIQYGIEQFQVAKETANDPETINALKEKYCPLPEELDRLIEIRNNLVDSLNNVGEKIGNIQISIDLGLDISNTLQGVIDGINTARVATSAAAAIAPVANVLGPLTVTLDVLQETIQKVEPQLANNILSLDATAPPLAAVSQVIQKAVAFLQKLDLLVEFCNPSANLTNLNESINNLNSFIDRTRDAVDTYKGFSFEIVTEAYTPTVNRIKAVAVNESGVPLLETALSFTTNPQTLIDELKLVIDRDNLKAY